MLQCIHTSKHFSGILGHLHVSLCCTSIMQRIKCLTEGHNTVCAPSESRTSDLSLSSVKLYH